MPEMPPDKAEPGSREDKRPAWAEPERAVREPLGEKSPEISGESAHKAVHQAGSADRPLVGAEATETGENPRPPVSEDDTGARTQKKDPSLWARLKQSAVHGGERKKPSRSARRQNKTPLLVGAGTVVFGMAIWLLFLVSSPVRKPPSRPVPGTTADLTPPPASSRSLTPTTESQTQPAPPAGDRGVTAADIRATSENLPKRPAPSQTPAVPPMKNNGTDPDPYALGRIPPPPPVTATTPPTPPAPVAASKNPLVQSALVFVRHRKSDTAARTDSATPIATWTPALAEQASFWADLPTGTRLIARLETPASTAVKLPVISALEYNYEDQEHQIRIPAGSRAFGTLEQADSQGFVGLHFTALQRPSDPAPVPFEARAIGLNYQPLKGTVTGRNQSRRLLVRAASGLGSIAAATVGSNRGTGLSEGLSNNVLIRQQLMNNIGSAGDQELQQLAYQQHVVVTVPGNTRFYLVIDHHTKPESSPKNPGLAVQPVETKPSPGSSVEEMRQLLELRRELNEAAQQPVRWTQPAAKPIPPSPSEAEPSSPIVPGASSPASDTTPP